MASKARVAVSALFCSTLIIGSYDVRPAYAGDGGAAVAAGIAGFAIGVMTGAAARLEGAGAAPVHRQPVQQPFERNPLKPLQLQLAGCAQLGRRRGGAEGARAFQLL